MSEDAIKRADRELFNRVLQAGFAGPAWDQLAEKLVERGATVLGPWIRTGRIFKIAAEKGHPLNPTAQEREWVATRSSDDFIQESVANALFRFRRAALDGRGWRAEGGQSLDTYFIGGCVYVFIELFRKSRKSGELYEARFVREATLPEEIAEPRNGIAPETDPAQSVADRLALSSYFARLSEQDRCLVWGKACHLSGAEIAEQYGLTSAKAVERRWARLRRDYLWLRRLGGGER